MPQKLLKYGIGIFAPETPAGFDYSSFESYDSKGDEIIVPAGTDAGTIRLDLSTGVSRIGILIEKNATARFIEAGGKEARKVDVDLALREGARATYVSLAGGCAAEFVTRRARLEKDAALKLIDVCISPAFSRAGVLTTLEGEGASFSSRGLFFGAGRQLFDICHEVRHLAPRTSSDLVVRGVLGGRAKAIYRGLIGIEKGARGSTGRQKEDTLLLSEAAEIDAVPNLEIANHDVRCGHAASVGRLDEEKAFYLMSRGLDRAAAIRALVEGHCASIVAEIGDADLEAEVSAMIAAKLDAVE